ncbi:hypothetical protein CCAX7_31630 [Capsulimonas corticalis]|uniref:Inner membrane protein YqiJ N-terminal domain-containing protein n=1 Tax=Capsulimonas corticalis TaxID=2219043 RepID=A0A402CSE3_9BACT|nr:OB-fold-containig protein [Capsulimonas corticalis]BDI31112.1 hypothetical protein CCAX7_31630 [Capsulimonas corticalis]
MNATILLNWYYLIFLLPAGVAVVLLLLSTVMSVGDGGADAETDADVDADVEADADGESESEGGGLGGALGWIGVGHAPLTLVMGSLLLGWGFTGFWAVRLLSMKIESPGAFIGPAVLIAAVFAVLIARAVAKISAYIVPKIQTAAVSRESLVGQEASVVYPVSVNGGRAFYYDSNAVLHDVTCRVRPGEPEIGKGRKVILGAYDEATGRFYAEPSPFDQG